MPAWEEIYAPLLNGDMDGEAAALGKSTDPAWDMAKYILAADYHSTKPVPATVSGSSVVGLSPQSTTALLNRVQQQNQFDASMYADEQQQMAQQEQRRQDRVFNAQEQEKNREQQASIARERARAAEAAAKAKANAPKTVGTPSTGIVQIMPDGTKREIMPPPPPPLKTVRGGDGRQYAQNPFTLEWEPLPGIPGTPDKPAAPPAGSWHYETVFNDETGQNEIWSFNSVTGEKAFVGLPEVKAPNPDTFSPSDVVNLDKRAEELTAQQFMDAGLMGADGRFADDIMRPALQKAFAEAVAKNRAELETRTGKPQGASTAGAPSPPGPVKEQVMINGVVYDVTD